MPLWTVRFKGPHQVEFAHVETKSKDLAVAQAVAEAWAESERASAKKVRVISVTSFIVADESILEPTPALAPIPPQPNAVQATTRAGR